MNLSKRIKLLRTNLGLTQSELAKLCGWEKSSQRISNYENNKREPYKTISMYRYFFATFVILVLVSLFAIGMYLGKDAIVMNIVDSIVKIGLGGLGGYAWAVIKNPTEKK
ncbi:hypothetical protein AQUSIP_13320 [Aquicella siphonis]|uniref:HTH cro/C1-type domain-containing protein n=1 Tax=Aquicella siphonis TaxID=254247 RepID=A0A5E4PI59_9COXI|nr:helix-turn-helix transcriptional regulator [Aquicella siphonis]VVC76031.1 hypothetical protein AQUSIP_13320 [Aquicella siphonis]